MHSTADTLPRIENIRYTVAAAASAPPSMRDAAVRPRHVGAVRLQELARPGMRVVIAFTDATRSCPDHHLITHLLSELAACGIPRSDVALLCATGLHRPITPVELRSKLGAALAESMPILDHDALDPAGLVDLGSIDGIPVVVARSCADADLLLATGVVEPHQYAGYSGGAKTVAIGCAGDATIEATHGARMLDRPGLRLGRIDDNPFQTFVREAGRRIGLAYVANVLLDADGAVIDAACGAPGDVHDDLVARARPLFEVPVERVAHLAIAGVSDAKAANLYQASRAVTYLALADRTPLIEGAPIILDAALPEGAGSGAGERRFYEVLAGAISPTTLIAALRRDGFPAGAQRAYILAQALNMHPVIVVAPGHENLVRSCHMLYASNMAEAVALAAHIAREHFDLPLPAELDCLVVPNALVTLPVRREVRG